MAESLVAFLVKELTTLLNQERTLLGDLQPDVQFIKDELGSMKAFLRDAESKEENVSELKEWIRQVREVACDAEDVLDDFVFHFARCRADGFGGCVQKIYTSIKNLKARHQIASEIRNIKARVAHISARHQRYQSIYGTQERGTSSSHVAYEDYDIRTHSSLLIEEAKLVGIDNPKRELISQILDNNTHLKVVSVVGMGGLGKTTLVRKVYDDAAVKKQFQIHAWLNISQDFQIRVTIKSLIQQLYDEINEPVPPQTGDMDVIRLSAFVKGFLQERRYILVLDDVWNIESWEAIRLALPDGNNDSCIFLTTRMADVASASCLESYDYVHRMRPLLEEDSWTLFCSRTFQSNQPPPYLENVSRNIWKKCEGLPLAIVVIGGVLALKDKDRIDEWEMIIHNLGGELEGSGKLDRIKRILFLGYNDLPYYLKSCLLYLSIYPEDYEIQVRILLEEWIALGFVEEKEGIASTSIATGYLNELINRSLIQRASTRDDGSLDYCRVHDLLHEIIVSKSKEQNFTTIAKGHYTGWPNKVRHLAIHGFYDFSQERNSFKSLRSLEIFGYINPLSTSVLSKLLCGGPKLIKVLNLNEAALVDIPKEVFKLFYLNYLNLGGTNVRIIPKSIGKLQNLIFLNLWNTDVTELPGEILKLRKLRCLYAGAGSDYSKNHAVRGFKSPDGIGKLISLEILYAIEAENDKTVREIGKLTKLKRLTVTKLRREDGKEFLLSLMRLTNLQFLDVSSNEENETLDLQHSMSSTPQSLSWIDMRGCLEGVPQWLISLQGLTVLRLQNSGLTDNDAIESLKDLPNLVTLILYHAYEGETLCFKTGGFRKLKKVGLVKLRRLKWVKLEDDSMPSLEWLQITGCKLMEEMPLGIQNLRNLESLQFADLSDELMQKVRNLEVQSEDYQRIAHIPEVCLGYWENGEWNWYYL